MTINRLNQGVTNQVLVKAVSGQTTPLLELQDSTGAVVSSIGPTGALGGTISQPQGLVHLETQTFSAVTSVNFSNGVFSATYDNYRLLIYMDQSPGTDILWRGRTAGSSNSNANYHYQRIGIGGTNVGASRVTGGTSARLLSTAGTALNAAAADIFTPFIAEQTLIRSTTVLSTGDIYIEDYASMFDDTTSFDSIEILSSGNMAGKAMLYGYRQ